MTEKLNLLLEYQKIPQEQNGEWLRQNGLHEEHLNLFQQEITKDMASLYEENKEIVFYRNKDEFVDKICYYMTHDDERLKIAEAGYERLMQDGHEASDRIREIIRDYISSKEG